MNKQFEEEALKYHQFPRPGKIEVRPTKPMINQRDLSLAYSPGVAAACVAIASDPSLSNTLTSRGNLVAVITNGSAVLGLGNIGALAGKPVMEGKGCLFKKFAGIDVFDIELNESDPDKIVDIVAAMEPTFGGINLEDIQAPQCFYIERELRRRMSIPVFHDDQHGTAIIVGAALLNALSIVGKNIADVKIVCSGGGAAAIACLDLLCKLGAARENITISDSKGVIYSGRNESMNLEKERYAQATEARLLGDIMPGADVFVGLSAADVLLPEMLERMADQPIIFALANPDPEIRPESAMQVRPDAIIATGRSDYPNQVNNVLCFPFIFRGALDVGATVINEEMKLAAVRAIARLARMEQSDVTAAAYSQVEDNFGRDYLIPRPFDPRLLTTVAPAVALAAMSSGVATRPVADIDQYRKSLEYLVYRSGNVMQPVFETASRNAPKSIVYAEGEDSRVLRAAQIAVDERLAKPVLIGRPDKINSMIRRLGLRLEIDRDFIVADIRDDWCLAPTTISDTQSTRLACHLVSTNFSDGMICGLSGSFSDHLHHVSAYLAGKKETSVLATLNLLMLPQHTVFICDTYINEDPNAAQLAEIASLAIEKITCFGMTARVAFLSHNQKGSDAVASSKLAKAFDIVRKRYPSVEIDYALQGDAALSEPILNLVAPASMLKGAANILVMPNLHAANITFNILKVVSGEGITVGPILMGTKKPAHILPSTTTVRGIVNMTALAAVQEDSSRELFTAERTLVLRR